MNSRKEARSMDWITGIQSAINYVEDNLEGEIDFEEATKRACSSPFHFQRIFSIICSYTLGDYIRMRRLSLAAEKLRRTNERIIDIALKYGYETPESFSRAFTRFHGVSPSEARKGATTKNFSRLFVKLILDGGNFMDYRIEKKNAFKVICKKKKVTKPQGYTATEEIAPFWNECSQNGTMEKLQKYARFDNLNGILGICFSEDVTSTDFPYGIGAEYNGAPLEDEGFDIVEIPAYTYAVFTCKGKMPEAFVKTYKQICTEFFPQNSSYEYGQGVELEVYPSANVDDPNFSFEIWIAVKEKE